MGVRICLNRYHPGNDLLLHELGSRLGAIALHADFLERQSDWLSDSLSGSIAWLAAGWVVLAATLLHPDASCAVYPENSKQAAPSADG